METKMFGRWVSSFWLWISMPHATYAIHVEDNKITEAPPIARWSIGYDASEVIEKLLSVKHAVIIRMKEDIRDGEN